MSLKMASRALALVICGLGANAYAAPVSTYEDLTAQTGMGFGNPSNRYVYTMVKTPSGAILAGTLNDQESEEAPAGAEIWRYDGNQWTRTFKGGPSTIGIRAMVQYKGEVYAGTYNNVAGANLIRSSDEGVTWTATPSDGPKADVNNTSVRGLAIYNDLLYVGTANAKTGGELWTFDGTSWKKVLSVPDRIISELNVFQDKLYIGCWNDGYKSMLSLYRLDGDTATNITPTVKIPKHNIGVMELIEFKGQYYMTTLNYYKGFSMLRTSTPDDPASWKFLTKDGFGDPNNAYGWAAAVYKDNLYIGTFNTGIRGRNSRTPLPLDGLAQLYYTSTGNADDYHRIVDDGFGNEWTWGIRDLLPTEEGLYIGTATNFRMNNVVKGSGGEQRDIGARVILAH